MERYRYGEDFQLKILAVLAQDPVFLSMHHDAIDPAYFEKPSFTILSHLLMHYYKVYHRKPDEIALGALVEDYLGKHVVQAFIADDVRRMQYQIYHMQVTDYEFVKDRVLRFGQRQAMKGAVNQIIDMLENDQQLEEARAIVDRAMHVGMQQSLGVDVGTSLDDLPRLLAESHTYSKRIPTMIQSIDRCTMGGLGTGEFGIVVGPAGTGKSTLLSNFGYGGFVAGKNIGHLTFELKEIDVLLKYAARHTGIKMDDIIASDPSYFNTLRHSKIPENRIKVQYFSPGTCGAPQIRSLLSYWYNQEGFSPDILILDYVKKMRYGSENSYGGLGQLSDDLIAIGDDFKCGVWTAQQTRRDAHQTGEAKLNSVADSWALIENADVAMTLAQSDKEHKASQVRIELGKVRRGSDTHTIRCHLMYDVATVKEWQQASPEDMIEKQPVGEPMPALT